MGNFILCKSKTAKHPYFHEDIGVRLYTIEELCYYIETHLYRMDEGWFNEKLFSWIGSELALPKLEKDLTALYARTRDIYLSVQYLLMESGCCGREEYEAISGTILTMRGKTKQERGKLLGDEYLSSGKYRQAAYTYLSVLAPNRGLNAELAGDLWHNLGVCYARLFLFEEAAECFLKAFKKRSSELSVSCYLYALNFLSEHEPMGDDEVTIDFALMRDALDRIQEVTDDEAYYHQRKKSAAAASSPDWREKQKKLQEDWILDFRKMQ